STGWPLRATMEPGSAYSKVAWVASHSSSARGAFPMVRCAASRARISSDAVVSVTGLHRLEILVDHAHRSRPLADRRRDPLPRAVARVAGAEDARHVGLEQVGIAGGGPAGRAVAVG